MAISTYAELKTAVAAWANRSDLTSVIPDFIRYAHDTIAREIVIGEDITLDSATETLPTYAREVVALYAGSWATQPLELGAIDEVQNLGTGKPYMYRVSSSTIYLAPTPDQAYAGKILYRLSRTFFASDSATNTVLTRYPHLYLHGALEEFARYDKDTDAEATWGGKFKAGLVDAIRAEQSQTTTGMKLQTRSGTAV